MTHKRAGSLKTSAAMKFRSATGAPSSSSPTSSSSFHSRNTSSGTQPVAPQASISHVLMLVALHACRRVVLVGADTKLGWHAFVVVGVSLAAELLPLPPVTYLADKRNALNSYFVKLGWAWTLASAGSILVLTAHVVGARQWWRVRRHVARLAAATLVWYTVTALFERIEAATGVCRARSASPQSPRPTSRAACVNAGMTWMTGFDISGHAFLLVFSGLLLQEEACAVDGWEGISDMIRIEDHARQHQTPTDCPPSPGFNSGPSSSSSSSGGSSPLKHLSIVDYQAVRDAYSRHTPSVRVALVAAAILSLLWDVMLVATALYFHTPLQKVIGGCVGVASWFALYRCVFPVAATIGGGRWLAMPGEGGLFRYAGQSRHDATVPSAGWWRRCCSPNTSSLFRGGAINGATSTCAGSTSGSNVDAAKFMGMPLYALRKRQGVAGATT